MIPFKNTALLDLTVEKCINHYHAFTFMATMATSEARQTHGCLKSDYYERTQIDSSVMSVFRETVMRLSDLT